MRSRFPHHPGDDAVHVIGGRQFQIHVLVLPCHTDRAIPLAVSRMSHQKGHLGIALGDLLHQRRPIVCAVSPRVHQDHHPMRLRVLQRRFVPIVGDGHFVIVRQKLESHEGLPVPVPIGIRLHLPFHPIRIVGIQRPIRPEPIRVPGHHLGHLGIAARRFHQRGVVAAHDHAHPSSIHRADHRLGGNVRKVDPLKRPEMPVHIYHRTGLRFALLHKRFRQRRWIRHSRTPSKRRLRFPPKMAAFVASEMSACMRVRIGPPIGMSG